MMTTTASIVDPNFSQSMREAVTVSRKKNVPPPCLYNKYSKISEMDCRVSVFCVLHAPKLTTSCCFFSPFSLTFGAPQHS